MARARNIKPGLFRNEILGVADPIYTLAFEGLWVYADREGRLEDRPIRLKADIFPYRDVNMAAILDWLQSNGFIDRYEVAGTRFIQVCNFRKHQNPHIKEGASTIPAPCKSDAEPVKHSASTMQAPETPERAGLIPDSGFRIPLTGGASMDSAAVVDNSTQPPPISPEFLEVLKTRPELDPNIVWPNFCDHYPPDKRTLSQWAKWVKSEFPPVKANSHANGHIQSITTPGIKGRDPTLARMDEEAKLAVPMPENVRNLIRGKYRSQIAVSAGAH